MIKATRLASVVILLGLFLAEMVSAQTDPGVQSGSRGTGAALPSVQANDNPGILAFFNDGFARFQAVESVSSSPSANNGLGPRFNSNQCGSCHAQPAAGGTSAAVNPQFQFVGNGVAPGGVPDGEINAGKGPPSAGVKMPTSRLRLSLGPNVRCTRRYFTLPFLTS